MKLEILTALFLVTGTVLAAPEPKITAPWSIEYAGERFEVPKPEPVHVTDERYEALPVFRNIDNWNAGAVLRGVAVAECSLPGALDPESVNVTRADGVPLVRGRDYQIEGKWGSVGRLEAGMLDADSAALISYRYTPMRLDSVVADAAGHMRYLRGAPAVMLPELPPMNPGERRLVNLFLEPKTKALSPENLYVVSETSVAPEPATEQQQFIPQTLKKLRQGEKVRILAWGDSVTAGTYLPEEQRWQYQFVARLRRLYPNAGIELITNGWGGRVMPSFHSEPPDSEYNYEKTVLAVNPDLVISEFVNDAGMAPEVWPQAYSKTLTDFRKRGFEWIILTPHYIFPEGMGLNSQNGPALNEDPRPYVAFLRRFAAENGIALADAARCYGRLWRCGIPYNIMMVNGINHPDRRGMAIYADVLMAIFSEDRTNGRNDD